MTGPVVRALASAARDARVAVCVDIGSTFSKLLVVELSGGQVLATASHRSTVDSDVLDGVDAGLAGLAAALPGVDLGRVLVCSSAGGGLRLAVVGYEPLVTARAGQKVGLSAGAKVVHVAAGRLDGVGVAALRAARPDVVLLVGGTDGGDDEVLTHNAGRLAAARLRVPVVLAGNVAARDAVAAVLAGRRVPVHVSENVLPRIGELNPGPARAAIREVFLSHVIGGKHLSRGPRLASLVRGPTPDLVLSGVAVLAEEVTGDLVVVDVGGATTDVYSARVPDAERLHGPAREVTGTLWHSRTVEGDLGMRWNAPGVVAAAEDEGLLAAGEVAGLTAAAGRLAAAVAQVPAGPADWAVDLRLARLAATVALRRHARAGVDLREVALVVGSGGVLRHADPVAGSAVLAGAVDDPAGGWALPHPERIVVDRDYVLAAAGLLADRYPRAARGLLRQQLLGVSAGARSVGSRDTPGRHAGRS